MYNWIMQLDRQYEAQTRTYTQDLNTAVKELETFREQVKQ